MSIMKPRQHFEENAAPVPVKQGRMRPVEIGSGGLSLKDIADLPLGEFVYDSKKDEHLLTVPKREERPVTQPEQTAKPKIKIKNENTKKASCKTLGQRVNSIRRRPITLQTLVIGSALTAAASMLPYAYAWLDTQNGGKTTISAMDTGVSTAIAAAEKMGLNPEQAIEKAVDAAKLYNYFDTKLFDITSKNLAARLAKNEYEGNPDKVKQAILSALMVKDFKALMARYEFRSLTAREHFPEMDKHARGEILARAFLKDVHESFKEPSELKDITLTDRDILLSLATRPRLLATLPPDIREGLANMIYDQRRLDRDAGRTDMLPAPKVRVEFRPTKEQQAIFDADVRSELGPQQTSEEKKRQDAEFARLLEAQTPKPHVHQHSVQNISGKLQEAAKNVPQEAPSLWTAGYCKVKVKITGGPLAKCLL